MSYGAPLQSYRSGVWSSQSLTSAGGGLGRCYPRPGDLAWDFDPTWFGRTHVLLSVARAAHTLPSTAANDNKGRPGLNKQMGEQKLIQICN